jgi:hypothetical protein
LVETVLGFSILGVEMGSGNLAIGQKLLLTLLFVCIVLVLRRLLVEVIAFAWRGRRREQVRFWVNRLRVLYSNFAEGSRFRPKVMGVHRQDFYEPALLDRPLDLGQWMLCIASGSLVLWVIEGMKLFRRRSSSPSHRRSAASTRTSLPATEGM